MVYCGKPSKGCLECRTRKTRCDRATPSCNQCIRANRTCPGYRSQLDLMFRNESENVIVKAVKAKSKDQPKPKANTPAQLATPLPAPFPDEFEVIRQKKEVPKESEIDLDNRNKFYVVSVMPSHVMFPTLDERALGVFGTISPTLFRTIDLVEGLCIQGGMEDHVRASMSAVGLACFSNASHAPELMRKAQRDYVTALRLTNAALRSPTSAKTDSTLFSVMVLSLYEMITGNNERSLDSWAEHIKGAAALVKLRGHDQFNTLVGQQMFLLVSSNMTLSCIQRIIPMPEDMINLRMEAEKSMGSTSPAWHLTSIIIEFTVFRAAVRNCDIVGSLNIIQAALEIDQRFIEGCEDLPEDWHYETVYTLESPDLIWNCNYHVYNQYWMAHVWNGVRTSRIFLHEIVRDSLLAASAAIDPIFSDEDISIQLESCVNIMLEMQADILASVPQHSPSRNNESSASLLDGSRSYFIMWPMYLAGAIDLATEPIRQWVIARLRDIGDTVGIKQATVVADYLAARTDFKVWDTKLVPALQLPRRLQEIKTWTEQRAAKYGVEMLNAELLNVEVDSHALDIGNLHF